MPQVTTGKARLSYPNLFEPKARDEDKPDDKVYSAMLMIPKSDTKTMEALWAAEAQAKEDGKSLWGGKIPGNLKPSIIKDGDDTADDYPERAGHWHLSVSSKNQPGVVDRNVQPIMNQSQIYAGCYVRAALNARAYNHAKGGKGVTFYLNHIQKWEDGEPLGGITRAEDVFEAIDELI